LSIISGTTIVINVRAATNPVTFLEFLKDARKRKEEKRRVGAERAAPQKEQGDHNEHGNET